MTICDAWTSLAVEYHTLTDRLFPETVVFTVEWCHLLFAVCVQSLNLQLVVTETYTGNILWQEDYCKDLGRHNVSTRTAALPTSLITRHSTVINCIYWTVMLTVQYTFSLPSNITAYWMLSPELHITTVSVLFLTFGMCCGETQTQTPGLGSRFSFQVKPVFPL